MMTQNHQFQPPVLPEEESTIMRKAKESPLLPVATAALIGIAGYRIYQARNRGGQKLSFYLIHTRLAAQGIAVACLGGMVLHSLGERIYNNLKSGSSDD